jgi:hypothetical protein
MRVEILPAASMSPGQVTIRVEEGTHWHVTTVSCYIPIASAVSLAVEEFGRYMASMSADKFCKGWNHV